MAADQLSSGREAPVEIYGADDRLVGRGEDRWLLAASALLFALAESELRAELDGGCLRRQHPGVDQRGSPLRQLPLVRLGKAFHQQVRDRQIEDRVAEEFELLVVVARAGKRGAMNQREREQRRIAKRVAEPIRPRDLRFAHAASSARDTRSIQPPPTTTSARYTTTACPGATA